MRSRRNPYQRSSGSILNMKRKRWFDQVLHCSLVIALEALHLFEDVLLGLGELGPIVIVVVMVRVFEDELARVMAHGNPWCRSEEKPLCNGVGGGEREATTTTTPRALRIQ
jgi:hypothetical protein